MVLIWGYCVYFIKIAKRDFKDTTKILNALAVVLILVNVFSIVSHEIGKPRLSAGNTSQLQAGSIVAAIPQVTALCLISTISFWMSMPRQALWLSTTTMTIASSSINLKDNGFYIANESETRTQATLHSIASTLNMEYFTDETLPS